MFEDPCLQGSVIPFGDSGLNIGAFTDNVFDILVFQKLSECTVEFFSFISEQGPRFPSRLSKLL